MSTKTSKAEARFGEHLTASGHWWRSAITSGPAVLWLTVFLLAPLLFVAAMSFLSRGEFGQVSGPLTLDNYKRLLGFGELGFDPVYPIILWRSVWLGLMTVVLCVGAGMPLAFFIARQKPRVKNLCLILVVVPFWTNLLIRTYAWQLLLSPGGWLARGAEWLRLVRPGEGLYPGTLAVAIGMLCDFLPFMVLPLYVSIEKLDWQLAEAAMDLGADRPRIFRHAILPQIYPGLTAGVILVFLPATGQFVIPDLLGGAQTAMLGNLVQQQFGQSRDWPFGSAIAMVALALVVAGIWFSSKRRIRATLESLS